jgi:hypothetical protein
MTMGSKGGIVDIIGLDNHRAVSEHKAAAHKNKK